MTSKPTRSEPAGFGRVGFFWLPVVLAAALDESMDNSAASMAEQIGQAAQAFEQERTGHAPSSVMVVLSDDALVITLHGSLSEAEKALAQDPDGAAKVQEFHRQLFATAAGTLRRDIERITGVPVREASAELEPSTVTALKVFASGTMVQVFLLGGSVATDVYRSGRAEKRR